MRGIPHGIEEGNREHGAWLWVGETNHLLGGETRKKALGALFLLFGFLQIPFGKT